MLLYTHLFSGRIEKWKDLLGRVDSKLLRDYKLFKLGGVITCTLYM